MPSPTLPKQHLLTSDPLVIPPGYGFNLIPRQEWFASLEPQHPDYLYSLLDKLLVWEPPKKKQTYAIAVDVASGSGQDRSVIEVIRCGTMTEPDEQVAQFVTDQVDTIELAYFIDPIGRFYHDDDEMPAEVAIECNGMGLTTQSELQNHCGYDNLYIWQHEDARDPRARYTRAFGWWTNRKTRPMALARYFRGLTEVDERTGLTDYRIHSPLTIEELRDFVSPGPLWMGEAASGSHDDCIMSGAISLFVATTKRLQETEPLSEARRRHSEEELRRQAMLTSSGKRRDFQNSDYSADDDKDDPASAWY
jgi:hypothetical protein